MPAGRVKVHENRLRRMAQRQGLALSRSRQRDPRGLDFGIYRLFRGDVQVIQSRDLKELERYLTGEP